MADSHSQATPLLAEIVRTVEPSLVCVKTPTNSGSGFVADDAGNVITNAHVVEHHADVTLEFVNGATSAGVVVGVNWESDLACVRLMDMSDRTPLPLGDSDSALIGEEVLAMGYPLSEILKGSPTVTRGIISAKRAGSLQTDAALNPGNSGGPLVDSRGRVIGVNTSVIEVAGGRVIDGIGFAIPINDVKAELETLTSNSTLQSRSRSAAMRPTPIQAEQQPTPAQPQQPLPVQPTPDPLFPTMPQPAPPPPAEPPAPLWLQPAPPEVAPAPQLAEPPQPQTVIERARQTAEQIIINAHAEAAQIIVRAETRAEEIRAAGEPREADRVMDNAHQQADAVIADGIERSRKVVADGVKRDAAHRKPRSSSVKPTGVARGIVRALKEAAQALITR